MKVLKACVFVKVAEVALLLRVKHSETPAKKTLEVRPRSLWRLQKYVCDVLYHRFTTKVVKNTTKNADKKGQFKIRSTRRSTDRKGATLE